MLSFQPYTNLDFSLRDLWEVYQKEFPGNTEEQFLDYIAYQFIVSRKDPRSGTLMTNDAMVDFYLNQAERRESGKF